MSKYYCLIAGLPDISLDDQKLTMTVKAFKEEAYEQLSAKDKTVFDLYFLKFDNENLLKYLNDKDAVLDDRANMKAEELEAVVKSLKEDGTFPGKTIAPYFKEFIEYIDAEKNFDDIMLLKEDHLSALYYKYAMENSNKFVSAWYEFNLNLNNILIASIARKYNFEYAQYIVGDNEVANALRTSSARDWGLTGTFDHLDQIQRISEEQDVTDKERKIDALKWNWLEENTFFDYFTIERVFAYLLKLEIIERWYNLNREEGEKILREMIAQLKSEVTLPEDFK